MTRSRRTFTAQEKAAIVMRHLVDKTPVSDLCDEFGLQPTPIYAWQKQLAVNPALAFQAPRQSMKQDDAKDRKIVALEAKIQQKNEVVDYVNYWNQRAEIPAKQIVAWLGVGGSKYFDWKKRYGKVNEHNGSIPRDHWLEDSERKAILDFHAKNPLEGYRRLTFMMLDANVAAVSPSSVYRVLSEAGVLDRFNGKASKKGSGFVQPLAPHEHWHVDVSYLNICGTFYFMCSILDGCSRSIVHWEIREKMQEIDIETILQRAREKYPTAKPRIITDNGPQFMSRDFKEFIRIAGMTHVKTSPYYPQSNGKIERYHRTIKGDCIRVTALWTIDDARKAVADYVTHYNSSSDYAFVLEVGKIKVWLLRTWY